MIHPDLKKKSQKDWCPTTNYKDIFSVNRVVKCVLDLKNGILIDNSFRDKIIIHNSRKMVSLQTSKTMYKNKYDPSKQPLHEITKTSVSL